MGTLRRSIFLLVTVALVVTALGVSAASAASSKVELVPILEGYARPLLVTHDGRPGRVIYVVEQEGRISRATFQNGAWRKLGTFLDLTSKVLTRPNGGEQGLLGLAFHPQYRRNGLFYVFYSRKGEGDARGDAVLAEYRSGSPSSAGIESERILTVIDRTLDNHHGGYLAFGLDGHLYVGLGDGGGHGDPEDKGQDLGTLLGSMLRIDPLDPDGPGPSTYKIPLSNPYVGKAGRDEIWAHGFRNPWRFSFDRANGDLWIGDVGEGRREEVNKARSNRWGKGAAKGKNYGWSDCEGSLEFKLDENDADIKCSTHVLPLHEYAHTESRCSVTGGYVYRGPTSSQWRGLYVAGDYCGRLFVLDQDGRVRWSTDSGIGIASFGEDSQGRLFAAGIANGEIYQVRLRGRRPSR